jgi:hypothetical protein
LAIIVTTAVTITSASPTLVSTARAPIDAVGITLGIHGKIINAHPTKKNRKSTGMAYLPFRRKHATQSTGSVECIAKRKLQISNCELRILN